MISPLQDPVHDMDAGIIGCSRTGNGVGGPGCVTHFRTGEELGSSMIPSADLSGYLPRSGGRKRAKAGKIFSRSERLTVPESEPEIMLPST